ncbi:hypothetical protein LR48_Vigan10g133000 [Vigna angularis]|uniref:Uncharacterized protein n=1 Tax=Phaseolus angularis TaxID=3914 RepID=A0A0L9VKF4_PHAAN|nr:hypothetical protein LR48_Vigan10g133000 [Vigna angularis]
MVAFSDQSKEERLSFWKVLGAKEVVEHGIVNRMDEVAMTLNNSQHRHVIRVLLKNDYFSIPEEYLPSSWRRESSLIP